MNYKQFRALLNLTMVSDPWPTTQEEQIEVKEFLSEEANRRGFKSWVGSS